MNADPDPQPWVCSVGVCGPDLGSVQGGRVVLLFCMSEQFCTERVKTQVENRRGQGSQ